MTEINYDNRERTRALISTLRAQDGVVKRSTLLEAATIIESLYQENAFMREVQQNIIPEIPEERLGQISYYVWKNGDWRL